MNRGIRFIASVLAASTVALAIPFIPSTGDVVAAASSDPAITSKTIGNDWCFGELIDKYNTDGDRSSLSYAECEAVTDMRFSGVGTPADGSWLKYFKNVTYLDISANDFVTIDISTMTNLQTLRVLDNETLTSLDLSKNTKLEVVWASSNAITKVTFPTTNSITELYLNDNQLTSLDVSKLTNLTTLEVYKNKLTSLNVSGCKNLKWLKCFDNKLTSVDISKNTNLGLFECYANNISSVNVYGLSTFAPAVGNLTRQNENGFDFDGWVRGPYQSIKLPVGCKLVNTAGGSTPTPSTSPSVTPTQKDISAATITVADQTYTGYAKKPSFTVTLNGKTLVANTDFTFSYGTNTGVGTGTVKITGKGDYTGSKTATFKIIGDFQYSFIEVASIPTQTWTGSALKPSVTVKFDGNTLTKDTDYTVSYTNNTNVGTATVTITGKGNYTGTKTATFKIEKASTPTPTPISGATVAAISAETYTGSQIKPSVTVTLGGKTLTPGTDYTVGYSNNTNVGTATVTITGAGNYGGTKTATFTINKANASSFKVGSIANQAYTGSQIKPAVSVTFNNKTLTLNTDYTVAYSNNTNVGTASVTITGTGNNFTGTKTVNFVIEKVSASSFSVDPIADQTYTGSEIKPAVSVKLNGNSLTKGTDYTVKYSNNTNAGTATVTITGAGIYGGTKTVNFTINKANASGFSVGSIANQAYTGSQIKPAVSVTFNNKTLTLNTDYTVSYSNNTNVGTATVTITGTGNNFTGTKTVNFVIEKVSASSFSVGTIADQTYTGSQITPAVSVTLNGKSLTKGTDYTVKYSNNTNAGTATVTITGAGIYGGTKTVTFTINKADIFGVTVGSISDQVVYTGNEFTPVPKVTFGSMTLVKDTDYTVAYSNNKDIGTATVTITGKGNFTGTKKVYFKIVGDLKNCIVSSISAVTYDGSEQKPSFSITYAGKTLTKDTDYTVAYSNNTAIGTATITITGIGNFIGTKTVTFKIKGDIKGAVISGIANQKWTGSAIEPSFTVTFGGKVLERDKDYKAEYINNTNVGTATIAITGIGDFYTGYIQTTFKIEKTVTITELTNSNTTISSISDVTYNGSAHQPSFTVTLNGKQLTKGTDYKVEYKNNINAGTATISITGNGNYSGTITKTFTINAVSISSATVSGISNQTYTGSAFKPTVTVVLNGKTLALNTDYTVAYSNNTKVGTATVTITGKGNYKGTISKTFTISAKSISGATVSGISNQTYTGSAFKPTVTVVLNGKTLTLNTDYTVAYSNNTKVGTATVTITGKGNYKGTISKTFTISAKSISGAKVGSISNQKYTGKAITPSVTVTLGGKTLVKNTDYTVAYSNNTKVGTATVTITGKGNYKGSVKTTFKIVATPTPTPATGVQGFCERLYTCALGRKSDPAGVKSWVDAIKAGADGATAARGFFFSPEFTNKNLSNTEYVRRLYKTFMDREPDAAGMKAWVDALNKGASREAVFDGFVNSTEWANICLKYGIESGGTGTPSIRIKPNDKITAFTTRLYTTCLGRKADPSGLKAWASVLANREATGGEVAHGFFFSDEFINHKYSNEEYVNRLYLTFLGRPADSAGKKAWVSALNAGTSREQVFNGFAESAEFRQMCAEAGIKIK